MVRWEPEAVEWLKTNFDPIDPRVIYEKFEAAVEENGWQKRSRTAIRLRLKRMGFSFDEAWEEEAIEWLLLHAGEYCRKELVRNFNKAARKSKKFQVRTLYAIASKAEELELSLVASEDHFSKVALARMLGICHSRVNRWEKKGLRVRRYGKETTAISREALTEWFRHNTDRANGIDEIDLMCVLQDRELVNQIMHDSSSRVLIERRKTRLISNADGLPVRCLETNRRFENSREAARVVYLAPGTIQNACRSGAMYGGYHWEYVA